MKTSYIGVAAMLLAMLAAPAFAQSTTTTPAPAAPAAGTEAPGMKELGIDISKAGSNSQQNQSFLKALPADRQAKVKEACQVELQQPTASQRPVIASFCKNLQGM